MEMRLIHLFFLILAVGRLTHIITEDRIFNPIRNIFIRLYLGYFITCQKCVSVWAGVICAIIYYYYPYLNWPIGLSGFYLLQNQILFYFMNSLAPSDGDKRLVVDVNKEGKIAVKYTDFDVKGIGYILQEILKSNSQQPVRPEQRFKKGV